MKKLLSFAFFILFVVPLLAANRSVVLSYSDGTLASPTNLTVPGLLSVQKMVITNTSGTSGQYLTSGGDSNVFWSNPLIDPILRWSNAVVYSYTDLETAASDLGNDQSLDLKPTTFTVAAQLWALSNVTGPLALRNLTNVTVNGNGAIITVTNYGDVITINNCSNITVRNLTINYDAADTIYWQTNGTWQLCGAINMHSNVNVTVENCTFLDCPDQGVGVFKGYTDDITVDSCNFYNLGTTNITGWEGGDGTCVTGFLGNNTRITGNRAKNVYKFYEWVYLNQAFPKDFHDHIIANNHIDELLGIGILIGQYYSTQTLRQVTITGNSFNSATNQVDTSYIQSIMRIAEGTDITIANNVLYGDNEAAILLYSESDIGSYDKVLKNVMISGNQFYSNRIDIFIMSTNSTVSDVMIDGNFFYNSGANIRGSCRNTTIQNNFFNDVNAAGGSSVSIWLENQYVANLGANFECTNILIQNNTFSQNRNSKYVLYMSSTNLQSGDPILTDSTPVNIRFINNHFAQGIGWFSVPLDFMTNCPTFFGDYYTTNSPEGELPGCPGSIARFIDPDGSIGITYIKVTSNDTMNGWAPVYAGTNAFAQLSSQATNVVDMSYESYTNIINSGTYDDIDTNLFTASGTVGSATNVYAGWYNVHIDCSVMADINDVIEVEIFVDGVGDEHASTYQTMANATWEIISKDHAVYLPAGSRVEAMIRNITDPDGDVTVNRPTLIVRKF